MSRGLLPVAVLAVLLLPQGTFAGGRVAEYKSDYSTGRTAADARTGKDGEPGLYFVKRVVDGDTLRLRGDKKVRLIGVDTPETKHPRKPVEYYGPEATAFTKRMVEKRYISAEHDRERVDRYGRLLFYVYRDPDRFFLNAELIRQGYGHAYTRYPFKHRTWFVELEREASEAGRGMWAQGLSNSKH